MRSPIVRASYGLPGELVVDSFAGGGGASTGLELALGRGVACAIALAQLRAMPARRVA